MNQAPESMKSQPPVPKTNGLAITSLVLGIIGFTCMGIITALPAIICGHVSLSQIKRSEGRETGQGMAITGLVLGYVGLFLTTIATIGLLAGMLLPAISQARTRAREVESMNNIKQIHVACMIYQDEHGTLPDSLNQLVEMDMLSADVLQSPGDTDPDVDYELVFNGSLHEVPSPGETVMIREKNGHVVGYLDGHVERGRGH